MIPLLFKTIPEDEKNQTYLGELTERQVPGAKAGGELLGAKPSCPLIAGSITGAVQSFTLIMYLSFHRWKDPFIHFGLKLLYCLFSLREKKRAFFLVFNNLETCRYMRE